MNATTDTPLQPWTRDACLTMVRTQITANRNLNAIRIEARNRQIVAERRAGVSTRELAERYDMAQATITRIIAESEADR